MNAYDGVWNTKLIDSADRKKIGPNLVQVVGKVKRLDNLVKSCGENKK